MNDQTETTAVEPTENPGVAATEFADINGRKWRIAITLGAVRTVKEKINLDLLGAADGKFFRDMSDDPLQLCDLLWVLIETQAEAAGVSCAEFWDAIDDTALDAATLAGASTTTLNSFVSPVISTRFGVPVSNSVAVPELVITNSFVAGVPDSAT